MKKKLSILLLVLMGSLFVACGKVKGITGTFINSDHKCIRLNKDNSFYYADFSEEDVTKWMEYGEYSFGDNNSIYLFFDDDGVAFISLGDWSYDTTADMVIYKFSDFTTYFRKADKNIIKEMDSAISLLSEKVVEKKEEEHQKAKDEDNQKSGDFVDNDKAKNIQKSFIKNELIGTYENDLFGCIKFTEENEYYLNCIINIEYGTFTYGDNNSLYLISDDASVLSSLGEWSYDKTADIVLCKEGDSTYRFIKADEESALQFDKDIDIFLNGVALTPEIMEAGRKELNTYQGYPEPEMDEWDNWDNRYKLLAHDKGNMYWQWSYGGGHGVLQQDMQDLSIIKNDEYGGQLSKYNLIRLLSCSVGQEFKFDDIQLVNVELWNYENRELEAARWNVVKDNDIYEFVMAYYIPANYIEEMPEDEASWYKELTLFYDERPISALDCMEGWPHQYSIFSFK